MFVSRNPFDDALVAEYPLHSERELESAMAELRRHVGGSCAQCLPQRVDFLQRLAVLIMAARQELATLISLEMGKLISESLAEVDKSAALCRAFAEQAPTWLETRQLGGAKIGFQPLGVVLAVMPWNFPLWQVLRCAVPAWAAGNTVALKHATNVSGCALYLQKLVNEAAAGKTYLRSLLIDAEQIAALIADRRIRALHFTGSVAVGRQLAARAAAEGKRSVLELGGSDPFIVLPGADIEQAATAAAVARFRNAGQSCTAAKRLIVVGDGYAEFVEAFIAQMQSLQPGDPLQAGSSLAPLARRLANQRLTTQLQRAARQGAKLLGSGQAVPASGQFAQCRLYQGLRNTVLGQEEVFGPVAAVEQVQTTAAAIDLANASRYGLGASIWGDGSAAFYAEAEQLADALSCGVVSLNQLTRSQPHLPFGGVKDSGFGYELGELGLMELVTAKTVLSV